MFNNDLSDEVFKYGTAWLKADFHLHTKADKQFRYNGEENSFVEKYIDKLKNEKISIGVITNHNKFDYPEFKSLKKKARINGILLLPGVELSVNDGLNGIHTLIIFSEEWLANGQNFINQFLSSAFVGKLPEQYENEDGKTETDILRTIELLDKFNKDYFFIFAHVEQNNGLWDGLNGGRLSEIAKNKKFKNKSLAFQKVRTDSQRNNVKLWFKNWYPAEVEGTDCKSIDEIGSKNGETWLKIGDYTFDAVKYALIDYENRVRNNTAPEPYRHSYLKDISFTSGILDGQTINFSPELNTLIGIRGSGKSSVLEALRYVLDIPFDEKTADSEYKNNLIEHLLGSGGEAVITAVDEHGSQYQIKRLFNAEPRVFLNNIIQPGVTIKDTVIKKPIYFGQKDLSASGEGFEKALVEKLLSGEFFQIRKLIDEKKQALQQVISNLQDLPEIDEQIKEYTQNKNNTEHNLNKFTEYGIESQLNKQIAFNNDGQKIERIISDVDKFKNELEEFISKFEDTLNNHLVYKSIHNQKLFDDIFNEYIKITGIIKYLKSSQSISDNVIKELNKKNEEFAALNQTFSDEFAGIRRNIEAELKSKGVVSLKIEEYPKLKSNISLFEQKLIELNRKKAQAENIKNDLLKIINDIEELRQQEFNTINERLEQINNKSSAVKIEAVYKGNKKEFIFFMKNIFRGSRITENIYKNITDDYDDFIQIYLDIENAKQKAGSYAGKFEEYFLNNLKELLTYQTAHKYIIKYKDKELLNHSLGQRASALILFVLNRQENDLIIIDQPEDDLDNQTIYEDVIKLIKELKPKTQFIFATHNANIPVLGDAEQILSCSYKDETITINAGSIDKKEIQKEIVDIMEGGQEAFDKRKEKYGIWKYQN